MARPLDRWLGKNYEQALTPESACQLSLMLVSLDPQGRKREGQRA